MLVDGVVTEAVDRVVATVVMVVALGGVLVGSVGGTLPQEKVLADTHIRMASEKMAVAGQGNRTAVSVPMLLTTHSMYDSQAIAFGSG